MRFKIIHNILGACLATSTFAADWHVATTGNDTYSGTSSNAAFKTIQRGVNAAYAGDTVYVHEGTYFEPNGVTITRSGSPVERITLTAVGGSEGPVVIDCSVRLTNWTQCVNGALFSNPNYVKIYYTDLDTTTWSSYLNQWAGRWNNGSPPFDVWINETNRLSYLARFPNGDSATEHYYRYQSEIGHTNFTDAINLTQATNFWDGALLCVYAPENSTTYTGVINDFNPTTDTLNLLQPIDYYSSIPRDLSPSVAKFFIQNCPPMIDEDWDWAVDVRNYSGRLYIQFPSAPSGYKVAITKVSRGIYGYGCSYVTIHGFHVVGANSTSIEFDGKVTAGGVGNIIQWCTVSGGKGNGITLKRQLGGVVKNCAARWVNNGFVVSYSNDSMFTNIWSSFGREDGFNMKTISNVVCANSAILNNWFENHPDGYQHYADDERPNELVAYASVRNCLLFNNGQGIQSADCRYFTLSNSVIVMNHWVNCLSFSGWNSTRWYAYDPVPYCFNNLSNSFLNNTLYDGAKSFGLYAVRTNNITVAPGINGTTTSGSNWGHTGMTGKQDFNLLWNRGEQTLSLPWYSDAGVRTSYKFPDDWSSYTNETLQDLSGMYASPMLKNVPVLRLELDDDLFGSCTTNRLYIDQTKGTLVARGVTNNGYIEIDGDGVARQVTNVQTAYLDFTPGYYNPILGRQTLDPTTYSWPSTATECMWWGSNGTNLLWDTRPNVGSPVIGAGAGGLDIGSSIVVSNYVNGDFNGDGTKDIPEFGASTGVFEPEEPETAQPPVGVTILRAGESYLKGP